MEHSYTIKLVNNTDSLQRAHMMDIDSLIHGSSDNFGLPKGVDICISELGNTRASYAQFVYEIISTPKKIQMARITFSGNNQQDVDTQMQLPIMFYENERPSDFAPIIPGCIVDEHGNRPLNNRVDIPLCMEFDGDGYIELDLLPGIQACFILHLSQIPQDLSDIMAGKKPEPVPTEQENNAHVTEITDKITIAINNTTTEQQDICLFGRAEFIDSCHKYNDIPSGVDVYVQEFGTGIETYEKFVSDTIASPFDAESFTVSVADTEICLPHKQLQTTILLCRSESNDVFATYPIILDKYVPPIYTTEDLQHSVHVPVPLQCDARSWMRFNILPQTQMTIQLNYKVATDEPASKLPSKKTIHAR